MEQFQKDVIILIDSALNGTEIKEHNFDYEKLYSFASQNQLVGLLYYPLSTLEDFKKADSFAKFCFAFTSYVNVNERQLYELNLLFEDFNNEGIDYLPLKGYILKSLFPHPEMRAMSDADILIKTAQYKKITEILLKHEFVFCYESDHELVWKKDKVITIELHKRLIPSYNKDYYNYYGDGWKLIEDNKMSREDTFIYIFTHFAKHFRDAGCGIRHVIDIYVYLHYFKDLDIEYIEKELRELQLFNFYSNVTKMLYCWFNGIEFGEVETYLTETFFACSIFGNKKNAINSAWLKLQKENKNVKATKLKNLLFPSFDNMARKYTALKKAPFLLPFAYLFRIIGVVFKKEKLQDNIKSLNNYDKEAVEQYKEHLNYVGLDFNFEEK